MDDLQTPQIARLPPVRACIFDMDGLLLNTEDLYLRCINNILHKHDRPNIPTSLIPDLMGVPSAVAANTVYTWARLRISREEFDTQQAEGLHLLYPDCEPLPGVPRLLEDLKTARNVEGKGIYVALASSSSKSLFELKTQRPEIKALFDIFKPSLIILGDNPGLKPGRGKPASDIFLLALAAINEDLEGEALVTNEECLVFEDSIAGVQAARSAGMRVVWVPNPLVATACAGREEEILAGRSDGGGRSSEQVDPERRECGECLSTLEGFNHGKYGIEVTG